MPGRFAPEISCLLQVVWRIPEELRTELALLDLQNTLQAYALYVNYALYCVH